MKRTSLLLLFLLILSLVSCGSSSGYTTPNDSPNGNNQTPRCTHSCQSATCTEPKTCSKCHLTQGSALGHTTGSAFCSRCKDNLTNWEIGNYIDEFKQPTGKKYIINTDYGTFSNSATTDSTLFAAVQVDKDDIGIMLWEYGNNQVKGIFDYEDYSITILDDNGTKHYFTGTMYKNSTRIYFKDANETTVLNLMRNNKELMIYVKSTKYSISTYLFSIKTSGFNEMYKSI